jgi:transcriptional regulator with XRE-family HTH domain
MASDLPAKLRAALDRSGITARDLAKRIPVDESTVSLWLAGERTPRMKNLEKFAKALGIELAELWEGPEAVPSNEAQLSVLEDMNHLTPVQQEAVAAMVRAMRVPKGFDPR